MRIVAPGLLCFVLSGCLPYYGPINDAGEGHRSIELSPRIYRVDFHYNTATLFPYRGPAIEGCHHHIVWLGDRVSAPRVHWAIRSHFLVR